LIDVCEPIDTAHGARHRRHVAIDLPPAMRIDIAPRNTLMCKPSFHQVFT